MMSNALNKAQSEIKNIQNNNENIVIFVSDGYPTESEKKVKDVARKLQNDATVYAVGFDEDIDVLKSIASDETKYKTTAQAETLSQIFNEITQEIAGNPITKVSQQGLIELEDIDTKKIERIVIKVNGIAISTDEAQAAIIIEGNKHFIDLNKINLSNLQDDVLIEYFTNE